MAKRREDLGMTIEEFLVWDDGTRTRYELEQGFAVAMNPPMVPHGRIAANVTMEIERHLAGREPCRAIQGAGLVISEKARTFYIPDVVMTCEEPAPTPYVLEPRLVVEVLSPGTGRIDQHKKVPAYAEIPSIVEIWLVASRHRLVQVWRRTTEGWVASLPTVGEGTFHSPALGAEIALDRLYRLSGI